MDRRKKGKIIMQLDKQSNELLDLMCLLGGRPTKYANYGIESFEMTNAIMSWYLDNKDIKASAPDILALIDELQADTETEFIAKLEGLLQKWLTSRTFGKTRTNLFHLRNRKLDDWLVQTYGANAEWLKYAMIVPYPLGDDAFLSSSLRAKNRAVLKEALDVNLEQAYWYFQGLKLLKGKDDLLKTKTVSFPLTSVKLTDDTLASVVTKDENSQAVLNRLLRYSPLREMKVNYEVDCPEPSVTFSYMALPESLDQQGIVPKMMLVSCGTGSLSNSGVYFTIVLDAIKNYIATNTKGTKVNFGFNFAKVMPRLTVDLPFTLTTPIKGKVKEIVF